MSQAEVLKQEGISRAVNNANRKINEWAESAYLFLEQYISDHKENFMVEEIRESAEQNGLPVPPSKRAWGAIIIKAHKNKLVKPCGFKQTSNPKAHKTPATLWTAN